MTRHEKILWKLQSIAEAEKKEPLSLFDELHHWDDWIIENWDFSKDADSSGKKLSLYE